MTDTNASERLTLALIALADRDQRTPCQNPRTRHRWTSDGADEREAAAHECRFCPLLTECAEAGDELKAEFVWGGTDRTKTQRRKAS